MSEFKWAAYWRNSLSDADSGKGVLAKKDIESFIEVGRNIRKTGKLDPVTVEALFVDEKLETNAIKIVYRPNIKTLKKVHCDSSLGFYPEFFTPLICPLWLNREGLLFPAAEVTVPRDLLSPLESSQFMIGTVDALDTFLTDSNLVLFKEGDLPCEIDENEIKKQKNSWDSYIEHCGNLYLKVCNKIDFDKEFVKLYSQPDFSWVTKSTKTVGMSRRIIELYDAIITKKPDLPLFQSYAHRKITDFDNLIKPEKSVSYRNGHSSDLYALADAQRDALAHALRMKTGDVLAVNGPPGTGKTTYVLSVVASMWVDAALKQTMPPVIVAASTNNQAVTNIIDAFGKDFSEGEGVLSGRWLPDIKSYGAYFPSRSRQEEAEKKFQTETFFTNVENSKYLEYAEEYFLNIAKHATDLSSVESVRKWLHEKLSNHQLQLKNIETVWDELSQVRKQILAELGEDSELSLKQIQQSLAESELLFQQIRIDCRKWKEFLANEGVLLNIFSWIKPVRKKRDLKREIYLSEEISIENFDFVVNLETDEIEPALTNKQNILNRQFEDLSYDYNKKKALLVNQKEIEKRWCELAKLLGISFVKTPDFDVVDKKADINIRFVMFRLAVHYWEATWLIESKKIGKNFDELKSKKGKSTIAPRWQRRMMLTPCIVSTFHSLPELIKSSVFNEKSFTPEPMFNFIDLLIVDEAGQVSPEVAGAAFALAKKSLVIGDIHQISPVRSITGAIDIGNLLSQNLVSDSKQEYYENILQHGRSVVNGSVMHIAQSASRFQYKVGMESGMYLREHRRCFDEIISFCNDLCYNGLLLPMRGKVSADTVYPAFGYFHIDCKSERQSGGSSFNSLEADTIANWLIVNREKLETEYKDKLENIVGIVTPFKGQVDKIEHCCKKLGIKIGKSTGELTVGTVHALQGAERKLIIFSPVYTKHNNGGFIDSSQSMLNVAVSRAKDSFLVFGDMDVISSSASTAPRGVLAKYLFAKEENELSFSVNKRSDLEPLCREQNLLNNAKAHDEHIIGLFDKAKIKVIVVSPWIQLTKIKSSGILDVIQEAISKNVNIYIYTDFHFNTSTHNKLDPDKEKEFVKCCEYLASLGVCVSIIKGVHSKILMADDTHITMGSFNWFSAARSGRYVNMETSIACKGDLKDEIETQTKFLQERVYKEYSNSKITNSKKECALV